MEAESDEGVACTTGTGKCSAGHARQAQARTPSKADTAARDKVLNDVVLPAWAARCGPECAKKWNDTIGSKYELAAKAK